MTHISINLSSDHAANTYYTSQTTSTISVQHQFAKSDQNKRLN